MSWSDNSNSSDRTSDLRNADKSYGSCPVCTGCMKCKATSSSEGVASKRSIQEVVDAVTGATWSTRNRIMEDLFREDLAAGGAGLPAFRPPGESLP